MLGLGVAGTPGCAGGLQISLVSLLMRASYRSTVSPPHHKKKGPMYKSPANQFMNPWENGEFTTLVAPYCAIPRDYLSDTPLLRAIGFLVSQHGQ